MLCKNANIHKFKMLEHMACPMTFAYMAMADLNYFHRKMTGKILTNSNHFLLLAPRKESDKYVAQLCSLTSY